MEKQMFGFNIFKKKLVTFTVEAMKVTCSRHGFSVPENIRITVQAVSADAALQMFAPKSFPNGDYIKYERLMIGVQNA
jgi:hypothetical protein